MRKTPRISVVVPSYGQGRYLAKNLESLVTQRYPDLEIIVVDGGSTDGSVDVIRRFEQHITWWVSETDDGQADAINKGMARATGTIVTWLNSDDWLLPGALQWYADMFERHPEVDIVVGSGRIVDPEGVELYHCTPPTSITEATLFSWMGGGDFMQPSTAFTRKSWQMVGGLDRSIHIALDVDLWIRMQQAGFKFASDPHPVSEALGHRSAKTRAFENHMRVDCALTITRHGGESFARLKLDEMAAQLEWNRVWHDRLASSLGARIERKLRRWLGCDWPASSWRDFMPPWSRRT